MNKPTACIDLDGVLNLYDGWVSETDYSDPRPGADVFLKDLSETHRVVILTTRNQAKVREWLDYYGLDYDEVTDRKPPAVVYLDDRGMRFDGSFDGLPARIRSFKAHWERQE